MISRLPLAPLPVGPLPRRVLLLLLLLPAPLAAAPGVPAEVSPGSAGGGLSLLEAVRLALARDPNIALEQARVRSSEGALLAAAGLFDPEVTTEVAQVQSNEPLSVLSSRETSLLQNSTALRKQFRTGFSITPELSLQRSDETAGTGAVNVGTLAFNLRQPLLRGRGRQVVAAGERSAERDLAAARLELRHATAARILAVAAQYWTLLAAERNMEILRQSEDHSRLLLTNTRKLIAADVTPAAELVQVEANLAAKESARIAGERSLFVARQDLGREIGLDAPEIARLPPPSDGFPRLAAAPPSATGERYVAGALASRSDLQAARERLAGGDILVVAAGDAVRPRLDLLVAPSYTGLVEGGDTDSFFSPLYRNVPGASVSLGFAFSWPTAGRAARGDLAQARAIREQGALAVELVAQQIGADVPAALEVVASSARQLAKAEEAVGLFERAVANEEKKLAAGTSTLLDVITQRDRLTSAQQGLVSAHLALALALARLRFETGTLLAAGDGGESVGYAELTTLPFALEEGP